MIRATGLALVTLLVADLAYAHGGGLNAAGCHNNRKTGGYHCHRSSYTPPAPRSNFTDRSSLGTKRSNSRWLFTLASKDQVYSAQTLLKRAGCGIETVDGEFGPNTKAAIETFQRSQNLAINGNVDDRLIADLIRVIDEPKVCEKE